MRYACSRCESRQSTDTTCSRCGHPVVLDLEDAACIERLRDEQRRRRDALHNRCRALGVIAAIPLTALVFLIVRHTEVLTLTGYGTAAVFLGFTALFITGLERTYGARRFFPYLDEPGR